MSSSPSGDPQRRSHTSQSHTPKRVGAASPSQAKGYVGRRAAPGSRPPRWLMLLLTGCVVFLVAIAISRLTPFQAAWAEPTPTPKVTLTPTPTVTVTPTAAPMMTVTPTAAPTPEPTPTPDYSRPVPASQSADPDTWFQGALFIGDSRMDGLRLYSGIKGADFLTHIGLSAYQVMEGKEVIRQGEEQISVLEAVKQGTYDKIYVSLGVNELGYPRSGASGFARTMGEIVDELRALQPDATVYLQAILPVNTAKCAEHGQRDYITNEAIASYNEALAHMAEEKEARLLAPPGDLLDGNGELREELSSDGIHMEKAGYVIWMDYLLTHTGQGEPISQPPELAKPTVTPAATPKPTPTAAVTQRPEPTPTATEQPEPEPTPTAAEPAEPEPSPVATEQVELPPLIIEQMGVPSEPADRESPSPDITEQEDGET